MNRLSEIIELLISLKETPPKIKGDDDHSSYSLRKLSTGTFELFVTLYLPLAMTFSSFIFLLIKELQQTQERDLSSKLKEKELPQSEMKINSRLINDAARILSIDPNNETLKKNIAKAAIRTLEYLEKNPCGVINGTNYSIPEISTMEIEKLTLEIEKTTTNEEI